MNLGHFQTNHPEHHQALWEYPTNFCGILYRLDPHWYVISVGLIGKLALGSLWSVQSSKTPINVRHDYSKITTNATHFLHYQFGHPDEKIFAVTGWPTCVWTTVKPKRFFNHQPHFSFRLDNDMGLLELSTFNWESEGECLNICTVVNPDQRNVAAYFTQKGQH